jgi:hypothetical protein
VLDKLQSALGLLRPRAVAQLRKSVDDLRGQLREQRSLAKQFEEQTALAHRDVREALTQIRGHIDALGVQQREQAAAVTQLLTALRRDLDGLTLREAQLRAVAQADLDHAPALDALEAVLRDPSATGRHVAEAIERTPLDTAHFPYMVIDDLLPRAVFDALVCGLPPVALFEDRPVNHQHLKPPFRLAPRYSRRIWGFMSDVVVPDFIRPAVLAKFRAPLAEWIRSGFQTSAAGDPVRELEMVTSDGRLLLRRRGYRIPPHRDPKWGFITCLLYLPRPGDDEQWGTQLYDVADDDEARGAKPHWIHDERCTPFADVTFRANRMLVFLNSVGAHGARIPEDAEPADLERYAYQFRIGPNAASIAKLMAGLSEERRAYWAGKAAADYF